VTSPRATAVQWEQSDHTLDGGSPTGNIVFIALPEPTFIALSNEAAKRGITAAQAIGQAVSAFLRKPPEE
jgi:hypothetical protein